MVSSIEGGIQLLTIQAKTENTWQFLISFRDRGGRFSVRDVAPNDVLIFDAAALASGLIAKALIKEVLSTTWDGNASVVVEDYNNAQVIDFDWLVGTQGFITRPTTEQKLLPAIAPELQQTPEALSYRVKEYNLRSIIDPRLGAGQGGIEGVTLVTHRLPVNDTTGEFPLSLTPLGGPVHRVAMLHLENEVVIEVTGVEFKERDGQWVGVLEPDDWTAFKEQVVEVTVSYLAVEKPLNEVMETSDLGEFNPPPRHLSRVMSSPDLDGFSKEQSTPLAALFSGGF